LNTGTSTDYNHTGLAQDTNKAECYKIQVFDNLNHDANSNEDCVWLDSRVPVIISFSASVSNQTVTLNYSADDSNSSGVRGYYVKKDSDAWIYTTNTSYAFTGLANATYTFYLRVIDNADNNSSDQNTQATVNYSPPPPGNPGSGPGGGGPGGGGSYVPPAQPEESIGHEGESQETEGEGSIGGEGGDIDSGPCDGVSCPETDDNPCTIDRCVDGDCTVINVIDGVPCNEVGTCQNGVCVMPEEGETPDLGPTGLIGLGESLALGIGILMLLAGGYSYLRKRGMGRQGNQEPPQESPYTEQADAGGETPDANAGENGNGGGKWAFNGK
jgi:hypothetical protein